MKSITNLLLLAILLVTIGCRPQQTQFDYDDITTYATIEGQLQYNGGQSEINGVLTSNLQSVAAQEVLFMVPLSVYSAQATEGYKTFKATTNSQGRYSIKLPLPTSKNSIDIQVIANEIRADYSQCDEVFNINPSFNTEVYKFIEHKAVAYTAPMATMSVKANIKYNHDILYIANMVNETTKVPTIFCRTVTLQAEIEKSTESLDNPKIPTQVIYGYDNIAGLPIIITAQYPDDSKRSFAATTQIRAGKSVFKVEIPVGIAATDIALTITPSYFKTDEYIQYNPITFAPTLMAGRYTGVFESNNKSWILPITIPAMHTNTIHIGNYKMNFIPLGNPLP